MKMLECPICGKEPNIKDSGDDTTISCCSLISYEYQKTIKRIVGIWNDRVIEYREMIALEKIAEKQFIIYQTNPIYPPYTTTYTTSDGNTVTYDENGNPIYS